MLEESITWFKKGCTLECWWRSWIWYPVSKIWILVLILHWIFFQRKSWFVKLQFQNREPIYFWTLEPAVTGPEAPGGSARSQDRGPRGRKARPEDWGHWTLGTAYDWHDGGPSQPHDLCTLLQRFSRHFFGFWDASDSWVFFCFLWWVGCNPCCVLPLYV